LARASLESPAPTDPDTWADGMNVETVTITRSLVDALERYYDSALTKDWTALKREYDAWKAHERTKP
jgi:plasmid maintenance system antidote protein VapI